MSQSVLDLDQRPGCCAFCDSPLPPSRRVNCGKARCAREYNTTWHRQLRRAPKRLRWVRCEVRMSDGLYQRLSCGHLVPAKEPRQRQMRRRHCLSLECREAA